MKCPKCNLALTLNDAEGHIGFTCADCEGVWLPSNYLESLKHLHDFSAEIFMESLKKLRTETSSKRACPSCNQTLETSTTNKIELDWCKLCGGVWFDRQELTRLVTFKSDQSLYALNSQDHPFGFVAWLIDKFIDAYDAKHPDEILQVPDADGYTPNHIPKKERLQSLIFSTLLFAYGAYGIYINDLFIPGKRKGIHLHNLAAWVMFGALICACLIMISVVADHYDKRNNEKAYRAFAKECKTLGWLCFGASLLLTIFQK